MVAPAALTLRLDQYLQALLANVAELPALAEEWDTLPDGERASTALHWDHLMVDYLTELDEYCHSRGMTAAQQARYRELLRQLKGALPIVERLRFYCPPVRLDG